MIPPTGRFAVGGTGTSQPRDERQATCLVHPPPTAQYRHGLVAGLFILKHMHNPSDEMLCERWAETAYFFQLIAKVKVNG
jgi:hypothetical protein